VDAVTSTGGRIEPGAAQFFDVTTTPLPTDTNELVFAATQTYSNGDVVIWNEREEAGRPEPAHPAPVLQLTGASAAVATTATTAASTAAPADPAGGGSSATGTVVLIVVVVVVAAGAAAVVITRQRNRAAR
jgi:hypothetical protein